MPESFNAYTQADFKDKSGKDLVEEAWECSICSEPFTKEILDTGKVSIFNVDEDKIMLICSDECRKRFSSGLYNGCML